MSIVRVDHNKNNPYVILNKKALEDPSLSWSAKGLWAYLMSRPDDWTVSVSHLSKIYDERGGGEKAIYAFLNELIEKGYCTRKQLKKEHGEFSKVEYIITEFKNKVPHSLQGDAVKGATTNKGSLLYIKEQQQGRPKDAVVVDFINSLDMSDKDKKALRKYNFSEDRLRKAFEFFKTEPIMTTLLRAIIWHCKVPDAEIPKPSLKKKFLPVRFKRGEIYNGYEYLSDDNGVGFIKEGMTQPFSVSIKSPTFAKDFGDLLNKIGYKDS